MKRLEIIQGERFGRFVILKEDITKGWRRYFLCRCDCGKEKIVQLSNLLNGLTKSCGCFREQATKQRSLTHGMSRTRFHQIWTNFKTRCLNKNDPKYAYYGGKGIKVSEKWMSFLKFKNSMLKSYLEHVEQFGEKNTQIDRMDNDKGYCEDNCRWATIKEQQNNKHKITTH